MNKIVLYPWIILGLFASNIFLLGFVFLKKPGGPPHNENKEIIIKKLGFDDTQIKDYNELVSWHQKEIRNKEDEMLKMKNQLFGLIKHDADESIKDSLMNKISRIQYDIEATHYKHFEDIKRLCRPNQTDRFDELMDEVAKMFSKGRMKPKPKQ